jgi:hypothetical protein
MRLRDLPGLLKLSLVLLGLQAASLLTYSAVGLLLITSQRAAVGRITQVDSLALSLASAVTGIAMAILVFMLAHRVPLARWVTVTLELFILLFGVVLIPAAATTGFFDLLNLWITVATVPAPALILFGLLVDRGVRGHFGSTVADRGGSEGRAQ